MTGLEQITTRTRYQAGPKVIAMAVTGHDYTPYEVAVALNLYRFNVCAADRANKLYLHFEGACTDREGLTRMVDEVYWMGSMSPDVSAAYITHALELFGNQAKSRTIGNFGI